jgi:hypothetical protein
LEKHAARFGSHPVYLAVETSRIFPAEVQDLWPKLINSETTASFFAQGFDNYSSLELRGVMIFDTRTSHFVSNRGFISVDTPPLGHLARFDITSPGTSGVPIAAEPEDSAGWARIASRV